MIIKGDLIVSGEIIPRSTREPYIRGDLHVTGNITWRYGEEGADFVGDLHVEGDFIAFTGKTE